ncbi:hypothetical protein CHS0354_010007 [Potamilus streckersoni]|nr:hypothetical protein CHS0354_010007 [Potamilus streckersoni]
MFSLQRRKQRPLGHIVADSQIDQQVEKAMFRTNAKILAEMCMNKKLKPREIIEFQSFQTSASTRPETRWLLTRSATLQRVNNAEFSKYDNRIRDRVVSADDIRQKRGLFLEKQNSMCNRENSFEKSVDSHAHCEVLGPSVCFDCIKARERSNILQEQKVNFPNIEVHPRSLIAPAKIEKMILSYPDEIFNDDKSYGYGAVLDSRVLFNEPIVYTQNEVYTRLRLLHKEKGRDVFKSKKKFKEKEQIWNIASSWVQKDIANAQPQAISLDSMKVSVKFKSP